jgi:hypothetical protein
MTDNPESLTYLLDVERRARDAARLAEVNLRRAQDIRNQMVTEWRAAQHAVARYPSVTDEP